MQGKTYLKGKNRLIMKAIMETIIPKNGNLEPGAADYDLIPRAETFIAGFDARTRFGFLLILKYIQYSALLRHGKVFTGLTPDQAVSFLEKIMDSPFYYKRLMFMPLKLIATMTFYDIDEVAAKVGYKQECCETH